MGVTNHPCPMGTSSPRRRRLVHGTTSRVGRGFTTCRRGHRSGNIIRLLSFTTLGITVTGLILVNGLARLTGRRITLAARLRNCLRGVSGGDH